MTATTRFLVKVVRTALCAVAANGEKDIDVARDEIVRRPSHVDRSARGTENCATFLMNIIDDLWRDLYRLDCTLWVKATIAAAETEHVAHAVAGVQLEKKRSHDVIQARTKSAAGYDAGARFLPVEKQFCARARQFKLQSRVGADLDPLRNPNVVAYRIASFR